MYMLDKTWAILFSKAITYPPICSPLKTYLFKFLSYKSTIMNQLLSEYFSYKLTLVFAFFLPYV
jgi:hypothetical protein